LDRKCVESLGSVVMRESVCQCLAKSLSNSLHNRKSNMEVRMGLALVKEEIYAVF
jgi:hypothetical protein